MLGPRSRMFTGLARPRRTGLGGDAAVASALPAEAGFEPVLDELFRGVRFLAVAFSGRAGDSFARMPLP